MLKYNKTVALLLSILIYVTCCANNINGLPLQYPSISFTETLPQNSRQIWDIKVDQYGISYFATSSGLISNTYGQWEHHTTNTNNSSIFTISISNDTIWVGKTNEIGFFSRDIRGKLIYHKIANFKQGTVWNIIPRGKDIFFQSEYSIYILNSITLKGSTINTPTRINSIYQHGSQIYYSLRNGYIGVISKNKLHHIKLVHELKEKEVRTTIVDDKNHYFFLLDGTILKYNTITANIASVTDSSKRNNIFTTTKLDNNNWLIGSITKGLTFCNINEETNTSHQINNQNGLDDNTVLSIYQNKNKQLWVGQDYGLNYIEVNSPFRKVFTGATVYDIVNFKDSWYIATNKGLYFAEKGSNFKLYPNTEGQVWSLKKWNNILIVSHINQSFIINADKTKENLCPLEGVHHIHPLDNTNNILIAISHQKTYLCTRDKNNFWSKKEILNTGYSRILDVKKNDSHSNRLYLIKENGNNVYIEITPTGIVLTKTEFVAKQVFSIGHDIVIIKDNSIYNPIIQGDNIVFKENTHYPFNNKIGYSSLNLHSANNSQDIILNGHNEILYYNQLKDGTYIEYPNLFGKFSQILNTKGEHLKIINDHVFLFTGQSVYSYNLDYRNNPSNKHVVISKITTYKEDSVSNYYYPMTHQLSKMKVYPNITFKYGIESLKFDDVTFCYRLSSSDSDFSPWKKNKELQFTNLRNGPHTLYIKAKINNVEYSNIELEFIVDGQWYHKSLWQITLGIFIILLTVFLANLRYKRLMKSRMETVRKQHTRDLLKTRNQQSVEFLTRIEQKNLFLEKIKTSLSSMRNEKSRELVRLIEAESKKESKDFVYFNFFADNQQEFISAMSRKFPNLTTNDLRLVLFIKLNMSTKDIAAITHTSAASVEKARYRLRKKMMLNNEISLSKYLLKFEKRHVD